MVLFLKTKLDFHNTQIFASTPQQIYITAKVLKQCFSQWMVSKILSCTIPVKITLSNPARSVYFVLAHSTEH